MTISRVILVDVRGSARPGQDADNLPRSICRKWTRRFRQLSGRVSSARLELDPVGKEPRGVQDSGHDRQQRSGLGSESPPERVLFCAVSHGFAPSSMRPAIGLSGLSWSTALSWANWPFAGRTPSASSRGSRPRTPLTAAFSNKLSALGPQEPQSGLPRPRSSLVRKTEL